MTRHNHVRLKCDSGLGTFEELPAYAEGPYFRLDSSPIALTGLAAGDLIEVTDDGEYRLIERGGWVSIQIFIETPSADGGEVGWMTAEAGELDGVLDSIRSRTFVLNVRSSIGHARTTAFMNRFLRAFPGTFYMYGNVFERETDTPLDWARTFLAS